MQMDKFGGKSTKKTKTIPLPNEMQKALKTLLFVIYTCFL